MNKREKEKPFSEKTMKFKPYIIHHHQCVLLKGRTFTANGRTKVAVMSKGRSSTANSGTKVAVLLGINRCSSFPLFLHPTLSIFSIWTDLKRSEKIPGARTWWWGEWIWLTGPSGLHWISPLGLNISSIRVFDQIRVWKFHHPSRHCYYNYDNINMYSNLTSISYVA